MVRSLYELGQHFSIWTHRQSEHTRALLAALSLGRKTNFFSHILVGRLTLFPATNFFFSFRRGLNVTVNMQESQTCDGRRGRTPQYYIIRRSYNNKNNNIIILFHLLSFTRLRTGPQVAGVNLGGPVNLRVGNINFTWSKWGKITRGEKKYSAQKIYRR